jgi:hypothetical protein
MSEPLKPEIVTPLETEIVTGKAKGGFARAQSLTPEERSAIARKGALAKWGQDGSIPEAIREGVLPFGEIDLECYVLKDRRRVFHKKGMARSLGMKSEGGNVFLRAMNSKGLGSIIPPPLWEKLNNPIVFKTINGDQAHGYEGSVLIEICDAIWEAGRQKKLGPRQGDLARQAEIILRSAAKVGIAALIDEATGFTKDKWRDEYRELFREFIRNEHREWAKEFPDQFFDMIYSIYRLPRKHKNKHPQFFAGFIRKYIYTPLLNSRGAMLELLDEKNPTVYVGGGRRYKLFQFVEDEIGMPALRAQIWQVTGIGIAAGTKNGFERGFNKAFPQTGTQYGFWDDLDDIFE